MKAVTLDAFGDVKNLHLSQVAKPEPAPQEVQIALSYAAVNPVDWKICEGLLKSRLPHAFPLIPGWDGAGTVTAVGRDVKNFKVGDEVFGYFRKRTVQQGTFAEYICFDAAHLALKPENITFAQAAALPLTSLTAWQALFDAAHLKKGETVLIHAGAGGVGGAAIQFAKQAGARVITTASARNHPYVKNLGADLAIDYNQTDFAAAVKEAAPEGVDVLFDTVGGETLQESYALVRKGGRLVGIVEPLNTEQAKKLGIQAEYVFVSPNGAQLQQIADLIRSGKVRPPAIEEMRLEDAGQALAKNRRGHSQGKIVLKIK